MASYELSEEGILTRDGKECGEVTTDGSLKVRPGYHQFRSEMEAFLDEETDPGEEDAEELETGGAEAGVSETGGAATGRTDEEERKAVFDERTMTLQAYLYSDGRIEIPARGDQAFRKRVMELLQVKPPAPRKGDPEPPLGPDLGDLDPIYIAWARENWSHEQFVERYKGRLPAREVIG